MLLRCVCALGSQSAAPPELLGDSTGSADDTRKELTVASRKLPRLRCCSLFIVCAVFSLRSESAHTGLR